MGVKLNDANRSIKGQVVKLDRGYPLVELEDGSKIRCEHATNLVKSNIGRAVIGDEVEVVLPDDHDMGIIEGIAPRNTVFIRKDPNEANQPQILAANFDLVIIAQPIDNINLNRLERELVLAFETGAQVAIVLTKADLFTDSTKVDAILEDISAITGSNVKVLAISNEKTSSINDVKALIPKGTTAVLIGKSGVGKSTLVNSLTGTDIRATGEIRSRDGKGRHTTVSREIIQIPDAGRIVDMPGVRGLGLWDARDGIGVAFSDVEALASECKFRDCKHQGEPGCAVNAAIIEGKLSQKRLDSYMNLMNELEDTAEKKRKSKWR